jgi:AcrR family transcriptional regulator
MTSIAEPLADRRRRLVRSELAQVAIALFAERGYDAVTVDDIALAAGMSQRTFFRYFATKDELVLEFERKLWQQLVAAFDARPASEGAVTALRESFRVTSHVEPADRMRVLQLARILDAAPSLHARATGERLVEHRAVAAGVARRMGVDAEDWRARAVVSAMSAVADAEFRAWSRDGGSGDPAERIVAALALVERGLAELDRPTGRARKRTPRTN